MTARPPVDLDAWFTYGAMLARPAVLAPAPLPPALARYLAPAPVAPAAPPPAAPVTRSGATAPQTTQRAQPRVDAPARKPAWAARRAQREAEERPPTPGRTRNVMAWLAMRRRFPDAVDASPPPAHTSSWLSEHEDRIHVGARTIVLSAIRARDGNLLASVGVEPSGPPVVVGAGTLVRLQKATFALRERLTEDAVRRGVRHDGGAPPPAGKATGLGHAIPTHDPQQFSPWPTLSRPEGR